VYCISVFLVYESNALGVKRRFVTSSDSFGDVGSLQEEKISDITAKKRNKILDSQQRHLGMTL